MAAKVTEKVQHNENPLLRLILQKYTQTARNSIHGPVALKDDLPQVSLKNTTQRTANPEIPIEFQFRTTNLEGYTVGCFIIGGEKRLCFSELVHTVLKDINVQQIFEKRDKLLIFTSKCSLKQLDELKYNRVLPWTSSSSNLITKSDAYRLIGALQSHLAPKDTSKPSPTSFGVYHECFGGCTGTFDTELYVKPQSLCIKCEDCKGLFSPPSFTSHSHTTFDNIHTCHWGFDTVRWRSYLMLVEEQVSEDLLKIWNSIKLKFNVTNNFKTHNSEKDQDNLKYAANQSRDYCRPLEIFSTKYTCPQKDNHSAFQPWSIKSRQPTDNSCPKSNKFTMIQKPNHPNVLSAYPCSTKAGKSHENCRFQSSVYMDCVQCKSAIESECSTFCGVAQVSEKLDEDIKPKIEPNFDNAHNNFSEEKLISIELSINKTLEKYLSKDIRSTPDIKELTHQIYAEFKQLHISQSDRLQEELILNQRLKTELQLIKMESDKKLADMRDTKDRIEQELETLHRERQKVCSCLLINYCMGVNCFNYFIQLFIAICL